MSDTKSDFKFQCVEGCGKCCSYRNGFVFLSEDDITRLEAHLGKPRTDFVNRAHFTGTRHGSRELDYLEKNGDACSFLRGTKCSVYEARPAQCRTFPFWPEFLREPKAWEELKAHYCPGIDEGKIVPVEEISAALREQIESDRAIRGERSSGQPFGYAALERRKKKLRDGGYPISKWILFCEKMLDRGFVILVYESRSTRSKYVTVCRGDRRFKVRFSNHAPTFDRQVTKDSDFYVGHSNFLITTTRDAIHAIEDFFDEPAINSLGTDWIMEGMC